MPGSARPSSVGVSRCREQLLFTRRVAKWLRGAEAASAAAFTGVPGLQCYYLWLFMNTDSSVDFCLRHMCISIDSQTASGSWRSRRLSRRQMRDSGGLLIQPLLWLWVQFTWCLDGKWNNMWWLRDHFALGKLCIWNAKCYLEKVISAK